MLSYTDEDDEEPSHPFRTQSSNKVKFLIERDTLNKLKEDTKH